MPTATTPAMDDNGLLVPPCKIKQQLRCRRITRVDGMDDRPPSRRKRLALGSPHASCSCWCSLHSTPAPRLCQRHLSPHTPWADAVVPYGHVLWSRSVSVELQPCGGRLAAAPQLVVGGHYVDDFNGLEYAEHADNAFHAFSDLFHILGLRVQESKAQPPQRRHVLQGVDVYVQAQGFTLSPSRRPCSGQWEGGHPAALRQVPRHHGGERRHTVSRLTLIPQSHLAHAGERHTSVHPVPGRGTTDRGDFCGRLCQSGRNDTPSWTHPG